jgi:hypothetical protein
MRKLLITLTLVAAPAAADDIGYPNGYRQWTHVKSMHIRSGHPLHHLFGGVHHIYANKPALAGYKKGKFSNGATLVLDVLEARDDGFAVSEGARKLVAVMHKDAKKYPQTGGWGFEAWRADNRKERIVGKDAAGQCFGCHAQQQKSDYVFSKYRL